MGEYSMKKLINDFLAANKKKELFDERYVLSLWEQTISDSFIIKNTRCIEIKNGLLVVQVYNASLRFELNAGRSSIIAKLNKAVGSNAIKEIIFK